MGSFRRLLAGIVLIAAVSASVNAGSVECASIHPGRAIVDSILNLDLQRAELQIRRWASAEPAQPLLDVFRALVEMARPYVDSHLSREPYWDRALVFFERVITAIEPRVEAGEADADAQLAVGFAQAYKSLIHAGRDQALRAYTAATAGRATLEGVIERGAHSADAYVLLGLFEVFVGSMDEQERSALKLVNFTGDRGLGINYLEQAVERATVLAPEAARLLLMDVGLTDGELCRYEALAHAMHRRYPGNRPIQLLNQIIPLQCRLAEREGQRVEPAASLTINPGCASAPEPKLVESPARPEGAAVRVPAAFENPPR